MTGKWLAAATSAAVVALSASSVAQGPHSDTTKIFNGASLTGWRPQGAAASANPHSTAAATAAFLRIWGRSTLSKVSDEAW